MKQDECIVSFQLYSGVKVICKAKWGIGELLLKSSFSKQMAQVASTRDERTEAGKQTQRKQCTKGRYFLLGRKND
jgi:hypothetical protein